MTIKRDQIIGKKRPTPVKKLDSVPGWDGDIYVRKLSAKEVCTVDYIFHENDRRPDNWHARFAVLFAADENGNRVFTDDDAKTLGEDSAHADAVAAIVKVGLDFNGMSKKARDEGKKNSEPTPEE